jgi:hypothetical protein
MSEARKNAFMCRLYRLDALDWLMIGVYLGLATWGTVAQLEPPMSLIGATGETFTRVVTMLILVCSVAALVGLAVDQTAERGDRHLDWELPTLLGLIGSWTAYNVIVTLIANGHGGPGQTIRNVFVVLTWILLVPLLVRVLVIIIDAVRTIRAGRAAVAAGLGQEPDQ